MLTFIELLLCADSGLCISCVVFLKFSQQLYESVTIIPDIQTGKLRPREVRELDSHLT